MKFINSINHKYLVESADYCWSSDNLNYFIETKTDKLNNPVFYDIRCTAEPITSRDYQKSLNEVFSESVFITDNYYDVKKFLESIRSGNVNYENEELKKESKLFQTLSSNKLTESELQSIYKLYETSESEVTDYLLNAIYEDTVPVNNENAEKLCEASMRYYEGFANFFAGKGGGNGILSTGVMGIVGGLVGKLLPGPAGAVLQAAILGGGGLAKILSCIKVTKTSQDYLAIPPENKSARKKFMAKKIALQVAQIGAAVAVSYGIKNWGAIATKIGSLFGRITGTKSPVDDTMTNVTKNTDLLEKAAKEPLPKLDNGQVDIAAVKADPSKYFDNPENYGAQISAIEAGQGQIAVVAAKTAADNAAVSDAAAGPAVTASGMTEPARVPNSIAAQANANNGDILTRNDGTDVVLTQDHIDAAKDAIENPGKYPGWTGVTGTTNQVNANSGMVGATQADMTKTLPADYIAMNQRASLESKAAQMAASTGMDINQARATVFNDFEARKAASLNGVAPVIDNSTKIPVIANVGNTKYASSLKSFLGTAEGANANRALQSAGLNKYQISHLNNLVTRGDSQISSNDYVDLIADPAQQAAARNYIKQFSAAATRRS